MTSVEIASYENAADQSNTLVNRAANSLSAEPRPFLRWAGSKQRLLPQILPYVPARFNTYHEPFLGSGALFFLLEPKKAMLSDACEPLIQTYKTVATSPMDICEELTTFDVLDRDQYYEVRAESPSDEIRAAARFIYLNRAGWNGLYRVNNKGQFNVPYGKPKSANIIESSLVLSCSGALSEPGVTIRNSDFGEVGRAARSGDFVYFDPPYVTGHNNNGFIDYNENLFSWADQVRLSQLAAQLQARGVHVVVSNALHASITVLYPTFNVAEITRRSTLAGNTSARKQVTEAVFYG